MAEVPPAWIRVLLSLLGRLPWGLRIRIGRAGGRLAALFPSRDRSIALAQLTLCYDAKTARKTVPRLYANLGQNLLESINLRPVIQGRAVKVDYPDRDLFLEWHRAEQPLVVLTGHTGNWDLLAAYVIATGASVTTIGQRAQKTSWQATLETIRGAYGIKTIWRGDQGGTRTLIRALRGGEIISALIDQDTNVASIYVPFMGRPAKTPSALIELALREKARLATMFSVRNSLREYKILLEELPESDSVYDILVEYHARLEKLLREDPSQWPWVHKRWRSTPEEGKRPSRIYLEALNREIDQLAS